MIMTRAEVIAFLQLDGSVDWNSFIDMNIPIAEQAVCDYCNNDFIDKTFDYFSSSAVSFSNVDNSINYTGIGDRKLVANDSIRVYGALRNSQTFTVGSVSADKIILNSIDDIADEDAGEGIFITRIKYPKPIKLTVSKMIKYIMGISDLDFNIKSEKIDDYAVSFSDTVYGYPQSVMSQLNAYRQLYKIDLFNCNRGCS